MTKIRNASNLSKTIQLIVLALGLATIFAQNQESFTTRGDWKKLDGALRTIDVANDGSIIGTNAQDQIYYRKNINSPWQRVPGALMQVSTGGSNDLIVGVNRQEQIYRWTGFDWEQMPGAAVWASIGRDGEIWVVNRADMIYRWTGSDWKQIDGAAKQVYVGDKDSIVVVNSQGDVYQRVNDSWVRINGPKLNRVAISARGKLAGVNSDGDIFAYDPRQNSWRSINGKLVNIGISESLMVGVNSRDEIYYRRIQARSS